MVEKRILALILGLFILLGAIYAFVTPVFEASDELWHYPMIRHLAGGNPLPVQAFNPDEAGPWKQEASQPPLYYYLGAALTFGIDTSDMEAIRWLNPHVDNGVITVDGNTNLTIHDPAANPWQGTLLAVRIVRLFSVLLGAVTVYLTYLLGKTVAPQRSDIALGAAAFNAFLPMFLFISGAVNNDNLAIPLASLGVLLMINGMMNAERGMVNEERHSSFSIPHLSFTIYCLLLGVVIGLAVLTKQGTFALLPLAWGTLFVLRWRVGENKKQETDNKKLKTGYWQWLARAVLESLGYFAVVLLPVLLIAGWWYWRNIQLYGDFLGWNAFIAVLGSRAQPASLAQLWDERFGFMMAFWGLFGGVNIPMSLWIYRVLNGVVIVAVVGFAVYAVKEIRDWGLEMARWRFNLQSFISNLMAFVERFFPLVLLLLFATAVILGLIQWATTTWSSQGRLVFTALSALSVLVMVGLVGWLPQRIGQWVVGLLAGFMFVVAAAAPWLWIRPAYQADAYSPPRPYALTTVNVVFGDVMRLTGFSVQPQELAGTAVTPSQFVDVTLQWEVLQPIDRDWSVFVHLTDMLIGVPIAQRDMYPGQGLRSTSLLHPGEKFVTFYRLFVPETAYAHAFLRVNVGLYDLASGERLVADTGDDAVPLTVLELNPGEGAFPNPTNINFMDEVQLMGYMLEPRLVHAGEDAVVTLYVQAKRPLTTDYSFSVQAVKLPDTTRWGSHDVGQPTSTWLPGETHTLEIPIILAEDTPQGVYPLLLILYHQAEDGSFPKLQLVTEDGRITQEDFLQLTQIRVEND
ncbi:MAG: hypothetical protein H6662_09310 [Ardenticatenaceae bacterium]|nr:hypothetical protein [Anaerolineales bacterium]MCB8921769.1 hypothetical protein [Ardenticatenaceae bacterium]MCB8990712.1 hypothetical protein [Ardenticatenaceae bacterium]